MSDKWAKSHPWRARFLRDTTIMWESGEVRQRQSAGTVVMDRRKEALQAYVKHINAEYGVGSISGVFNVSRKD